MKTLLLFALLCGAVSATDSTSGTVTFRHLNPDDPLSWPNATLTWDHPNTDKSDPYKFNQPTKESTYTMTMDEGFKLSVVGHVLITKQEAQDVVRAMEILDDRAKHWGGRRPDADDPKYEGDDGPMQFLLDYAEMVDKDKADMKWARSILGAWNKKIGEAK